MDGLILGTSCLSKLGCPHLKAALTGCCGRRGDGVVRSTVSGQCYQLLYGGLGHSSVAQGWWPPLTQKEWPPHAVGGERNGTRTPRSAHSSEVSTVQGLPRRWLCCLGSCLSSEWHMLCVTAAQSSWEAVHELTRATPPGVSRQGSAAGSCPSYLQSPLWGLRLRDVEST